MPVFLRSMTSEEFGAYEDADARRYSDSMVRAGYWSEEVALKRAKETHATLLPKGVESENHHFLVIEASEETRPIGVIWLSVNRETTPPTGFIYDLLIHGPFRRKGYGRQSMIALEEKARELGLASISLHVFEDNEPARALYGTLGYRVKSMNMTKVLPGASDKGAA